MKHSPLSRLHDASHGTFLQQFPPKIHQSTSFVRVYVNIAVGKHIPNTKWYYTVTENRIHSFYQLNAIVKFLVLQYTYTEVLCTNKAICIGSWMDTHLKATVDCVVEI